MQPFDRLSTFPDTVLHPQPASRATGLWRIAAALALVLVCGGIYWGQLLAQQRDQRAFAENQAQLRATQMSATMATQVETLVGGLEYLARSLAMTYEAEPKQYFPLAVRTALSSFPKGSIAQIAIANAAGEIVYSSLDRALPPQAALVSIADREHFRAHVLRAEPRLYISRPVLGRVSGQWSVQFTYPVLHGEQFKGVVVLSIAPDYLSSHFREVFTEGKDVALLVRSDGSYLARSHQQEAVLHLSVPPERDFLVHPEQVRGHYQAKAPIDGTERLYAWQRLHGYPLIVSVGLERARVLAATERSIRESRIRNAAGTVMTMAAALWIALLFVRQRQSQMRLERHRQRYQLALEGGKLGTWEWTTDEAHFQVDERWHALLGTPASQGPPSLANLHERTHPDDWAAWRAALDAHVRGETETFDAESRLRHQDGTWRWIHVCGRIIQRAAPGHPQRITGTYADATERYAAEAARAELQQRLAKLVAQVPGTVYQYRLDPDGSSHFPYASSSITVTLGIAPDAAALNAEHAFVRIHPDDRDRVRASIAESARTLAAWHCEWRQILPNGDVRWFAGSANPEREADGGTLWHGYLHDVTEQHAFTEALRRSEERLRLTVAAVQDGLWEWNTATGMISLDTRCLEMLGYEGQPHILSFRAWQRLVHPDQRRALFTALQRQVALSELFDVEVRLRAADGQWRWVEIRGHVAPTAANDSLGSGTLIIGTQTDIGQRRADSQLQHALLDNAAAALFVSSPSYTIELANQRAEEIFSQDGLPLKGRSMQWIHRDTPAYEEFVRSDEEVRRSGSVYREYQLRVASGALRWFSLRGTLLDPDQPAGNLIWTLMDTTERRQAEEALSSARAHLLEIIQHFPGGVLVQDAAGSAVVVNQAMCDVFRLPSRAADVIGCSREALESLMPPEARPLQPSRNPSHNDAVAAEYEIVLNDARTVRIQYIPIRKPQGEHQGRLWIAKDVTERRRHEQTLERLATTDALTGLANRRAFMARLEEERMRPSMGGRGGMLIMLDLDHFKRVNDTWGHAAGDEVLVHLARLLRGDLLRATDLAGRLGGEEFAVLLPDTTAEEALGVAERLRRALEQSKIHVGDGATLQVTMSLGVAPITGDALAVLAHADIALYEAKNTGRNKVVLARSDEPVPLPAA